MWIQVEDVHIFAKPVFINDRGRPIPLSVQKATPDFVELAY